MGIADHFVTERLPKLLSQFARTYPLVKLEVEVNSGIALMESLDAYRPNLVIASREDAKQRPGQLLFREALVWVASKDFELSGTASIPLVLLPAPCQFRREALVALEMRGWTWTTVYTGNSVPSIQAAVVAGLGVSVLGLHSVLAENENIAARVSGASQHGHHALWRRKVSGIDCQSFGRLYSARGSRKRTRSASEATDHREIRDIPFIRLLFPFTRRRIPAYGSRPSMLPRLWSRAEPP